MTNLAVVRGEVLPTLVENEAVIARGMSSFVETGRALQCVRDSGQYIEAGFDSFEDYCEKRWDLKQTHQRQLRAAARVVGLLETGGGSAVAMPQVEWQVRPLVTLMNDVGQYDKTTGELRNPEAAERAVITAWQQVVEKRGIEPIRERDVREAVYPSAGSGSGKPGWHELLGRVGDALIAAEKHLSKAEDAITREPGDSIIEKAGQYAEWAEALALRLHGLGGEPS